MKDAVKRTHFATEMVNIKQAYTGVMDDFDEQALENCFQSRMDKCGRAGEEYLH